MSEGGLSTMKMVAVFGIIFGCFAILYPKIFHPMLMGLLGLNKRPTEDEIENHLPPNRRMPMKSTSGADDAIRRMHAGPHPGMRAAAEMRAQQQTTGSGRGGMMTMILPLYAVGIVAYLIYTLTKVFGGRSSSSGRGGGGARNRGGAEMSPDYYRNVGYDADSSQFRADDPQRGLDPEFRDFLRRRQRQDELESLIMQAEQSNLSESELHRLQHRLLETESQMAQILSALKRVEHSVPGIDGVAGGVTGTTKSARRSGGGDGADDKRNKRKQRGSKKRVDETATNTPPQSTHLSDPPVDTNGSLAEAAVATETVGFEQKSPGVPSVLAETQNTSNSLDSGEVQGFGAEVADEAVVDGEESGSVQVSEEGGIGEVQQYVQDIEEEEEDEEDEQYVDEETSDSDEIDASDSDSYDDEGQVPEEEGGSESDAGEEEEAEFEIRRRNVGVANQ